MSEKLMFTQSTELYAKWVDGDNQPQWGLVIGWVGYDNLFPLVAVAAKGRGYLPPRLIKHDEYVLTPVLDAARVVEGGDWDD
jgi:hypothetical protein